MATPNIDQYIVRKILAPSGNGLLLNAVALTIKNISAGALSFIELGGQPLFTGTAAANGSLWGFQRVSGTPANGTVLTPFRCHPGNQDPASLVEVRHSDTGAITGVTPTGQDIFHLGIASQVGSVAPRPMLTGSDENAIALLAPADCLIVYAATVIITGSRATVGLRWFQVTG